MLKTKLQRYTVRKSIYTLIVFLVISVSVSYSQTEGTLHGCQKWFNTAMKDFKKDKKSFVSKYCKLPFLAGSGGDAYYSYYTIEDEDGMLGLMEQYISGCKKELSKSKNVGFTQTYVSDSTLSYLCNSLEFNERNLDGTKVNPDAKPPYYGLIAEGETVFRVAYGCGYVEHYDTYVAHELYVIFDKVSKSYKFWAANSGL